MTGVIDYEILVDSYENRLLSQLRGHGVDLDFLELWVPDDDPVASILNMAEAAEASGETAIAIRVNAETMPHDRLDEVRTALSRLGDVTIEKHEDNAVITIGGIGE